MLYFLKIRRFLHTETDYLTNETVFYLLTETDYLTKETVLIQLFYENKK